MQIENNERMKEQYYRNLRREEDEELARVRLVLYFDFGFCLIRII